VQGCIAGGIDSMTTGGFKTVKCYCYGNMRGLGFIGEEGLFSSFGSKILFWMLSAVVNKKCIYLVNLMVISDIFRKLES